MRADADALTLQVTQKQHEADDVVSLRVRCADSAALPAWNPGAHIEIELGPTHLRRHYSLCGGPDEKEWRIAVLREPQGQGGSAYVHDALAPGDTVRAWGPMNDFALVEAERYVFVAGGIGITPILPMARHTLTAGRPTTVVYGGRRRARMAFLHEVVALADVGAEVHISPEDETGLLDLARHLAVPDDATVVYCCGPLPLLEAVERQCAGWPPGSLHRESFTASVRPHAPADAFEVELARSGRRLQVAADCTLLEALEDAGLDHPHSCRAGICGTCLVGVLDGEPEHFDDVLTDEERASGTVMLPCVSRSRSPVLVLDL